MTSEPAGLPIRRSGKVLLVDGQERLLLFRGDERLPGGGQRVFWFPPGGGVEADETFAECAARELFEETGMRLSPVDLGPPVAVRSGAFALNGVDIWSDEIFFFVRIHAWDVDTAGFTDLEREIITAHRWWSLEELQETDQLVFPPPDDLAALISRLFASGPPPEPVELTWERRVVES